MTGRTVRIITLASCWWAPWPSRPSFPCTCGCQTPWKARRPVSALIHAATMVTAGVYLIARSYPLFHSAPFTENVVVIIGGMWRLLRRHLRSGQ